MENRSNSACELKGENGLQMQGMGSAVGPTREAKSKYWASVWGLASSPLCSHPACPRAFLLSNLP